MLKIFAFLFLLVAVAAPALGDCPPAPEKPTPESVQAAMSNARDHGFLWEISRDGRTSYLYGTIHAGKLDWMFPGPNVSKALEASDTVAVELDLLDEDVKMRIQKGMAKMRGKALPKSLAKRIRKQAESLCVPYESISRLAPELQIDMLLLALVRADGLDAAYAADAVISAMGHNSRKSVVSLETPELQLRALQLKNAGEGAAFVRESLKELESGRSRKMLVLAAKLWADSDYDEMGRYEQWCQCLDTAIERKMMQRLLDDRNVKLAQSIDELHQSGKQVFAAVGSLHLFGPRGLPELMRQRGYEVERIDLKPQ